MSIPGYRPKLIASDLDGTIVPHDEPVSQRTIEAFQKAHSMGIEIFYVTGRPPRWMEDVKKDCGVGNAICANGAILFDLMNLKVVEQWLLSEETQREIAEKLRQAIPGCHFAIEHGDEFFREKLYNTKWDTGIDNVGVELIEEKINQPAFKMMVRHPDHTFTSDEMLERALSAVGDICNPTHSNPAESHLEISALGVSKGETLAKIATPAGIAQEDVVSFGDNPNDFSMLEFAGRSYAMIDGHPDGIKYATASAPPCDEDGVAQIVEELINLPLRS